MARLCLLLSIVVLGFADAFFVACPLSTRLTQQSFVGRRTASSVSRWPLASTASDAAPEDDLKGWQLVWEDIKTLPPEEHSQTPLILRSTTDTSYLKDRFFVLMRHRGGVKLIDSSCGRCSFPLINAPVVDEPDLGEEDNSAVACKVCGMRHSISTGKALKPRSTSLGLMQGLGNTFFRRGEYKDIESHPTKVLPDGKIYAKISPRKEKRPTTDMIVL